MSAVAEEKKLIKGGSFLIEERAPEEIFTPEDFTEEHRMIAETTRQFIDNEVVPRTDELEKHNWNLSRQLIAKAAELGLIGANIPEEYGGLGLDQTSGALIGENIGRSASFATTLGAESGIGLLPIIYFGTDTATLLPSMKETGADVMGVDWRFPLDQAWSSLNFKGAVQGNLDPVLLFAGWKELKSRAEDILQRAGGRAGHIFNLGHGILPETPVENVKNLAQFVQEYAGPAGSRPAASGQRKPQAGSRSS